MSAVATPRSWLRSCRPVLFCSTILTLLFSPDSLHAQAVPDRVKDFSPGRNAGFGAEYFPVNALGLPQGTVNAQYPNHDPKDLLSLGTGGSITYEFSTNRIVDGDGPDFTVFENPVEPIGQPDQSFVDSAIVSVSQDAVTWHTFPVDLVSTAIPQLMYKSNYAGFAGVKPSYSSTSNGISPYDPSVSGGDQFDIGQLSLPWIRFIRIQDTGEEAWLPTYDKDGDLINDFGNLVDPDPTKPGDGISAGFDIDAVVGLNTEPWSPNSQIRDWELYE